MTKSTYQNLFIILILSLVACEPAKKIGVSSRGVEIVESVALPKSFSLSIEEKVLAWGTDFNIVEGENVLGKIDEKILSWGATFNFSDNQARPYGSTKSEVFSWGSKAHVYDAKGNEIGLIEEEILKSLFKVATEYTIRSALGKVLSVSKKMELLSTEVLLYDSSETQVIAKLYRPAFNLVGDKWQLEVYDSSKIDLRFLLAICAHKTYVDNARSSSN